MTETKKKNKNKMAEKFIFNNEIATIKKIEIIVCGQNTIVINNGDIYITINLKKN